MNPSTLAAPAPNIVHDILPPRPVQPAPVSQPVARPMFVPIAQPAATPAVEQPASVPIQVQTQAAAPVAPTSPVSPGPALDLLNFAFNNEAKASAASPQTAQAPANPTASAPTFAAQPQFAQTPQTFSDPVAAAAHTLANQHTQPAPAEHRKKGGVPILAILLAIVFAAGLAAVAYTLYKKG